MILNLFLLNKKIRAEEANTLFSNNELCNLIDNNVLIKTNKHYFSDISILPYGDKYFLTDNFQGKQDKYYVYTGADAIFLSNYIKKEMNNSNYNLNVLEVGTGPGTIAISIANKVKNLIACDINKRALDFAEINKVLNKVTPRKIVFQLCDYKKILRNQNFDVVISNPPRIPISYDMSNSFPIYAAGGQDGLEFVSELVESFYDSQSKKLYMILLSGVGKNDKIIDFLKKYNLNIKVELIRDISIYSHYFCPYGKGILKRKMLIQNCKNKNIKSFHKYIVNIERGEQKLKINHLYKLPQMMKIFEYINLVFNHLL